MATGWTSLTVKDSDDTLSSGFTFPRVPSSHPTTAAASTTRSSSGLISPLLSPPIPSHSPRLQHHRSSGFQSITTGSSSSDVWTGYYPANTTVASPTGTIGGYHSPAAILGYASPQNLDTLLERPYYDSPPGTADRAGFASETPSAEVDVRNGWGPAWLRRPVLSIFLGAFMLLAVVGEIVLWALSSRDLKAKVEGLWTFGPVVVSSILAMLWSRVEFQALQYTPWMILHRKPVTVDETRRKQAQRTVLLDYPSMNSYAALKKAFHNRHPLVVASVAASLLLHAQVSLSTSIFHAEIRADGSKYLKARPGTLHTMAGVFFLLGLCTMPMLYHAPPKHGIAPRDPTSLGGTAALLASSKLFLSRLTGTGNADMDTVASRVPGSWYTTVVGQRGRKPEEMFQLKQLSGGPMLFGDGGLEKKKEEMGSYRPWTVETTAMAMAVGLSAVLLGGLFAIFGIWGDGNGFSAIDEAFIAWTSVPTLLFVSMAVLFNRIDLDTRRLAPFIKLATEKSRFRETFGRTYLNEFGLQTAGKSFGNKDWAVFLKKWMAMLGWLMPIFTAGLFAIRELAQTAHMDLRQDTWFRSNTGSGGDTLNEQLVEQILIQKTPKYPTWTYEALAFPKLEIIDHGKQWPLPETQLTAKVTATKASLSCETATLRNGSGAKLECVPLGSDSDAEKAVCEDESLAAGLVAASCSKLDYDRPINYIWGSCAKDGLMTVLMCNETFVEVEVASTFRTEDLTIDTNAIPLVNSSSETATSLKLGIPGIYGALTGIGANETGLDGLDGFFKTLVLSRLEMPRERLVGEDRRNAVAQAIKLQHGILRAQVLNSDTIRRTYDHPDAPRAAATIKGSVAYFVSRLKQSRVQTAVLGGLLAVTLVLAALSFRTVEPCTLPKDPGSIAAQASLLADSTLWWRLPDGAEHLSDEDLARCLRRKTFKMGWFTVGASAGGARNGVLERNYGISVVQDEGKVARVELEGDSMFPGRYISMRPGVYGDAPIFEKL